MGSILDFQVIGAGEATMSSREIGELTGKKHPHVKRDIERMFDKLGIDAETIARAYIDCMNRKQSEYALTRELTETLVAGYGAVSSQRIMDFWRSRSVSPSISRADASKSQAMAVEFYPRVFPEIACLSREEMALLLHGLACKVELIAAEWEYRESYMERYPAAGSECPRISKLLGAMEDYRHLAFADDVLRQVGEVVEARQAEGSAVYVAEFSDGNIKIGFSIDPKSRIRNIAAANQARLLRSWVSDRLPNAKRIELRAHRHFADSRVGGEFFKAEFDQAVAWIAIEVEKESAAC